MSGPEAIKGLVYALKDDDVEVRKAAVAGLRQGGESGIKGLGEAVADKDESLRAAALSALAEGWPEALRLEIVQLNLADARMALPVQLVEEALKRGKVAFPWKVLRSWIRPSPLPTVSAHDNLSVELPLKVIAPLFLSHQKNVEKSQHRTEIDESIPNLFFGFPQPNPPTQESAGVPSSAPAHAVAKPIDTNYYVWDDSSESARVDETEFKRKPTPGTTFITRYATPNEVVSRAAALEGVAGALIALPDGLMVASKLSPDLNGDTLAAFLPQIFAKVSQCTKELRMGELNNLNFTVGNVPWKIFRVNAIFFSVFGQLGDGDQFHIVLLSHFYQVIPTRHSSVIVHHLYHHSGGS